MIQQTSSKCIQNTRANAGRLLDRVNTDSLRTGTAIGFRASREHQIFCYVYRHVPSVLKVSLFHINDRRGRAAGGVNGPCTPHGMLLLLLYDLSLCDVISPALVQRTLSPPLSAA